MRHANNIKWGAGTAASATTLTDTLTDIDGMRGAIKRSGGRSTWPATLEGRSRVCVHLGKEAYLSLRRPAVLRRR